MKANDCTVSEIKHNGGQFLIHTIMVMDGMYKLKYQIGSDMWFWREEVELLLEI